MAIAFAYLITNSRDPCHISISTKNIGKNIIEFLEKGIFLKDTFVENTIDSKSEENNEFIGWVEQLYCHCSQPDLGTRMKNCDRCDGWFHEHCEDFTSPSQIKYSGPLYSDISWYCCNCYDGININFLPEEVLSIIFKKLCLEDEKMHRTIALVCRKWDALTDKYFRDAVHISWLDNEFDAKNWPVEVRRKERIGFVLQTCINKICGMIYKPKIGHYRDPLKKTVEYYSYEKKVSDYCDICDGFYGEQAMLSSDAEDEDDMNYNNIFHFH